MLISSVCVFYIVGQNKRGCQFKNLFHLKPHIEYYSNIHSAPFNPSSTSFCIVTMSSHEHVSTHDQPSLHVSCSYTVTIVGRAVWWNQLCIIDSLGPNISILIINVS